MKVAGIRARLQYRSMRRRAGRRARDTYKAQRKAWLKENRKYFAGVAAVTVAIIAAFHLALLWWPGDQAWGAGFVAGALGAALLLLRETPPTIIEQWQEGAWGEKFTADELVKIAGQGWTVLNDESGSTRSSCGGASSLTGATITATSGSSTVGSWSAGSPTNQQSPLSTPNASRRPSGQAGGARRHRSSPGWQGTCAARDQPTRELHGVATGHCRTTVPRWPHARDDDVGGTGNLGLLHLRWPDALRGAGLYGRARRRLP